MTARGKLTDAVAGFAGSTTPRDRVRAVYPHAYCKKGIVFFYVYADDREDAKMLGRGTSNQEAWSDATQNLAR